MAAIALPTCPMPIEATPFLRDFGGDLVPFMGGPEQRINRIGTRWGVRYTMPEMEGEEARQFVARLTRGKQQRVLMPWPVTDFDPGSPGTPLIHTAAAGGSAIVLKGMTVGYVVREGQFFSIVHNARRYIHMSTGDATVSALGTVPVSIFPPLRSAVAVNDVVEIEAPMIEGNVMPGEEWGWTVDLIGEVGLSFTLAEGK